MGQALFEAGFIEPVLMDNCFSDSPSLFRPAKLSRVHNKDILVDNQTSCDTQEPSWVKSISQNDLNIGNELNIDILIIKRSTLINFIFSYRF